LPVCFGSGQMMGIPLFGNPLREGSSLARGRQANKRTPRISNCHIRTTPSFFRCGRRHCWSNRNSDEHLCNRHAVASGIACENRSPRQPSIHSSDTSRL